MRGWMEAGRKSADSGRTKRSEMWAMDRNDWTETDGDRGNWRKRKEDIVTAKQSNDEKIEKTPTVSRRIEFARAFVIC